MARRRAPTSIRQARARKVTRRRGPVRRTRTRTTTTPRGTTTRTSTSVRLGRAGRGGTGIRRTVASSFRPKPRVVRRVQAPPPRIKSSSRRVSVRKSERVQRASRGGTGSFAIRRKAQAKALRNPIKNFVATSIGTVKGAGKATRQLIDTEIADFNIRTKRKGTEVEFPTTSKFIDFFNQPSQEQRSAIETARGFKKPRVSGAGSGAINFLDDLIR